MKTSLFSIALVVILALLLASCATDTLDLAANRRGRITNAVLGEVASVVAKAAWQTLANMALSGGDTDFAHSAAAGLWSASTSVDGSAMIRRVINVASDDQLKPIATAASAAFTKANPTTPAEAAVVTNTIAKAISDTALGLPSPYAK